MSKNILVIAILFSLALSIAVTQEANALVNSQGQYVRTTTASLGPSKVCGDRICHAGENSKWSDAVLASQRQGHAKAAGGYNGMVIMHQLFVNSLVKSSQGSSIVTSSHTMENIHSPKVNVTSSK